ncbi:universal stress protein [Specibacter sp. RAF43]|uniref:universal stress protein n=1 Tax=Specibacter sp. RAF43 TaxID=3233057 RepID=UPI003F9D039F
MDVSPERNAGAGGPRFGVGAVVVGLLPDQDPAVLHYAVALAAATGSVLIGGYVDPGSYLIEWDPHGNVLGQSLDPAVGPDDDAAQTARELGHLVRDAAVARGVRHSFRTLGGEPAMALGRLAASVSASVIVVGARRPGLVAGVEEILAGSVVRKLLFSQHIPVLAIPRPDARPPLHG